MAEKPPYKPTSPGSYTGNQVIINSDRLLFNARQDSILLYSDKVIGFSTNGSFHFDTSPDKKNSKFIINSPNIYLGLGPENELPTQCAVLSDDLIIALEDIVKQKEWLEFYKLLVKGRDTQKQEHIPTICANSCSRIIRKENWIN